ncbi:helix-turn-helix transcriptional regulator [Erythrobacter sp. WH131]|uniref:Helix-turn-helix transcriptional regulator n=2 Tax=Erythrobacter ani TaxID=2827235 RepID=A0ABS6SHQ9_9SPHN|nr:helix-turn-helix transcriptional regulator [Erythrobacter ani]
MIKAPGYGQYCPLSMAAEILCTRWTMLVMRELVFGYTSFNDISRGVPRMSRSLLSSRLKELANSGIVKKTKSPTHNHTKYTLTPAGDALSKVVFSMADWAQEWLRIEPALEDFDSDHLMWNIRHKAKPHPELPNPFIVHFFLHDQTKKRQDSWLIFEGDQVDLCIIDRDFDVDMQISVTAKTLARIYLGRSELDDAIATGELEVLGDEKYAKLLPELLGRSRLANILIQPEERRASVPGT